MKKIYRILAWLLTLNLLFSGTPFAAISVYAQEILETTPTPEVTPVPTPEPTIEITPEPTTEITPEVTLEPTLEPTPEPTVEITPEPTTEITPEVTPETTLEPTTGPESVPQTPSEPSVTPEVFFTPAPVGNTPVSEPEVTPTLPPTPTVSVENDLSPPPEMSILVLENTSAPSVMETSPDPFISSGSSAALITDKADYAPTDAVLITGINFEPNTTYNIHITTPTGDFSFSDTVTSDSEGKIVYSYQLDGTYRPFYDVYVNSQEGDTVATVSFLDSVKITICHATSSHKHPYQVNTPSTSGDVNGHDAHTGPIWYPDIKVSWGDIIPPFPYGDDEHYPGLNWTAEGILIHEAGCRIPDEEEEWCGDGIVNLKEECDFGSTSEGVSRNGGQSSCSDTCQLRTVTETCDENFTPEFSIENVDLDGSNGEPYQKVDWSPAKGAPTDTTYGGWDGDQLIGMVVGPGQCSSDTAAKFTIGEAGKYITSLAIRSLDGISGTDSFDIYLNDIFLAHYKDNGKGGEIWDTQNYPVPGPDGYGVQGPVVVRFVSTDPTWDGCDTWGQVAVNWVDVEAYVCESKTSTVKICKMDPGEKPLPGWKIVLKGEKKETVNVYPSNNLGNPGGTTNYLAASSSLPLGDYVLEANGYYTYRSTVGAEYTDAVYSKRLSTDPVWGGPYIPWVNVNSFSTHPGWLGIKVDGSTDWSDYFNPSHIYAWGETGHTGSFSFTILDDYYGDNSGFIPVSIFKGYTDVTGKDGCVVFEDVPYGDYELDEIMKSGWEYLRGDRGKVTIDSDREEFKLVNSEISILGQIIACKYYDNNTNGGLDTSDWPLPNISIKLYKDQVLESTLSTGSNGCVTFSGLTAGTYKVEEDITDPDLFGYYSTNSTTYYDVEVTPGSSQTVNFLNAPYRTISGQKFEDLDADGYKDPGEPGLSGWTIYLDMDNNGLHDPCENSALTDANGYYEISGLVGDSYRVREVNNGWTQSYPILGYHDIDLHTLVSSSGKDFGNYRKAYITVGKEVVDINDNPTTDASGSFEFNLTGQSPFTLTDGQTSQKYEVDPGTFELVETVDPDYTYVRCIVSGHGYQDIDNGVRFNAESNNNIIVTCTNRQNPGEIIIEKVIDRELDSDFVPEFNFNLTGQMTDTVSVPAGGSNSFTNLLPGSYLVGEQSSPGWQLTDISCNPISEEEPERDDIQPNFVAFISITPTSPPPQFINPTQITLNPGQTIRCTFTNTYIQPELQISKSNNASGSKNPGESVVYTITVKVLNNDIKDVQVIDAPPSGIKYRASSWTASHNNLPTYSVTEPTYASPGTWNLGDLSVGDEVILTYVGDIQNDVIPGDYKDLAWASGKDIADSQILALATDPGTIPGYTNYVSTVVNVGGDFSTTSSYDVSVTGEVLGASTELPATGTPDWLTLSGIMMVFAGLISLKLGRNYKRKYE